MKQTTPRLAPEHRKAQLIECARAEIAAAGIDPRNICSRTAARAQCSRQLVFAYFNGAAALLDAVASDAIERNDLAVLGHCIVAKVPRALHQPADVRRAAVIALAG